MKCASCHADFTDGVQCSICKRHFDFNCVNISETGWRKLGTERRSLWKCPACRGLPPSETTSQPVTLDSIMGELLDMKRQLTSLPTLVEDVRAIKEELNDLQRSCEFNGDELKRISDRLSGFESRIIQLENLKETVCTLESDISKIKMELSNADQRSRLNNVEIKGIPLGKGENLFNIMESISNKIKYPFTKSHINFVTRIPLFNSSDKSIIVSFLNRYAKEDFVAAARSFKTLSTRDIGFQDTSRKIYINDHLNPDLKKLLNGTKEFAKLNNYKYVWVKHAKIHIRKDDTSRAFIISKQTDLNKLT